MPNSNDRKHLRPWSQAAYQIEIEGLLEESWSDCFAGMRITFRKRADQTVVTRLSGRIMDQSELTGVLNGLAEMHLPILSVKMISENNGTDGNQQHPEGIFPAGSEGTDTGK